MFSIKNKTPFLIQTMASLRKTAEKVIKSLGAELPGSLNICDVYFLNLSQMEFHRDIRLYHLRSKSVKHSPRHY